jgi:hypothetical protein
MLQKTQNSREANCYPPSLFFDCFQQLFDCFLICYLRSNPLRMVNAVSRLRAREKIAKIDQTNYWK